MKDDSVYINLVRGWKVAERDLAGLKVRIYDIMYELGLDY